MSEAKKNFVGPKVFHVEDDVDLQHLVPVMVEVAGGKVVASMGLVAEALAAIPQVLIDEDVTHVIVDNILPDGRGKEVVEKIRQFPELGGVIVIANSGNPIDEIGYDPKLFDDYIQKPASIDVFLTALTRVYDRTLASNGQTHQNGSVLIPVGSA